MNWRWTVKGWVFRRIFSHLSLTSDAWRSRCLPWTEPSRMTPVASVWCQPHPIIGIKQYLTLMFFGSTGCCRCELSWTDSRWPGNEGACSPRWKVSKVYLSQINNVFVSNWQCICLKLKMYLSQIENVFFSNWKCIFLKLKMVSNWTCICLNHMLTFDSCDTVVWKSM